MSELFVASERKYSGISLSSAPRPLAKSIDHQNKALYKRAAKAGCFPLIQFEVLAADYAFYEQQVKPFLNQYCVRCHGAEVSKAGLRFDEFPNFKNRAMRDQWQAAWTAIGGGQMPPKEERAPATQEMIPVLDWIREHVSSAQLASRTEMSGGNGVRRMTARETVRSWQQLLQLEFSNFEPDYMKYLAKDPGDEGFINRGDRLLVQEEHIARLLVLAEQMLLQLLPDQEPLPERVWSIKPGKIAQIEEYRLNFRDITKLDLTVHGNYKRPSLSLEQWAMNCEQEALGAMMYVHPSCYTNEQHSAFVLNPVWKNRQRPRASGHGEYDYIVLHFPESIDRGILRVEIKTRSLLPPNERSTPFLALDAFRSDKVLNAPDPYFRHDSSHWPLTQIAIGPASQNYVVEIPLELTSIDFKFINSATNPGLRILLSNRPVTDKPVVRPDREHQKRLNELFTTNAPPEGTPENAYFRSGLDEVPQILIEQIDCTVRYRNVDNSSARRQRVIGQGSKQDLLKFAQRVWGRPVKRDEMKTIFALYDQFASSDNTTSALRQAMSAILVDHQAIFLFDRRTDPSMLNSDLARRLAMTFWGQCPDEHLQKLAKNKSLTKSSNLRSEIRRLIADPRFEWFCSEFTRQWLGLHALEGKNGEWAQPFYIDLTSQERKAAVGQSLLKEPGLFLLDAIRSGKGLRHLIAPEYLYLNGVLAHFYGLETLPHSAWQQIKEMPEFHRQGLLSMAGPIAVASRGEAHPQIYRGVYLLTRVLGMEIGVPPPNVPTLDVINEDKSKRSLPIREKLKLHSSRTCSVCHDKIDPLGFAWEIFDPWGNRPTAANRRAANDSSGRLPDGSSFRDLNEMSQALLKDPFARSAFPRAFAQALMRYLLGRDLYFDDEERLVRILGDGNPRLPDLIEAILLEDLK